MRAEPMVVRQFDEPVVSAARSVGLGGTLIYCQYAPMAVTVPGVMRTDAMSIDIEAPATIFMHGQFEVVFGTLTPADGRILTTSHLDPGPSPEPGWAFTGPTVTNNVMAFADSSYSVGSFSWTGVMSRDPGTITLQPLVSFTSSTIDIDESITYGTCFISVIVSASTGSDCLEYSPPA